MPSISRARSWPYTFAASNSWSRVNDACTYVCTDSRSSSFARSHTSTCPLSGPQ